MAIETTLEYFNHRYSWPEEMISGNKPVEFIFTFESELNVDVLWSYIADTNFLAKFGDYPKENMVIVGATHEFGVRRKTGDCHRW